MALSLFTKYPAPQKSSLETSTEFNILVHMLLHYIPEEGALCTSKKYVEGIDTCFNDIIMIYMHNNIVICACCLPPDCDKYSHDHCV